ncbi:uncharacterized protein BP01DRAFT_353160 [Aspergillus saccharolyticus JOP 1030-1]|uniref:Uncharacterized protein n=1 Tax=Aspergillus saccharolyticus JOP 1030-1 TaxID=1450539 RepID=A0A318ZXK5_9EURO|nr:hypothetical protein BP01DRAFT_353160 [Aspergillus saccharolyticus JOP 1030-1]PYH48860.1 hypothetical protein BP01DRAFT_353160 [Aspergillus saccharolyticus JOP 1030-1]
MTSALREALICSSCTTITRIPVSTFRVDIESGRYDPSRAIPFQSTSDKDADLAPDEVPPLREPSSDNQEKDEMALEGINAEGRHAAQHSQYSAHGHEQQQQRYISYTELTPPSTPPSSISAQSHLYEALIAQYLLDSDDESGNQDVAVARYRADYHIHVHYMLRRGVLSICRDGRDVYELKGWKGRLHAVDSGQIDLEQLETRMMDWRDGISGKGGGGAAGKSFGGYYASNPYQPYYPSSSPTMALPRTQRLGAWPDDANQLMASQVALWRRRGLSRQRRVEDVRIRWAFIMEERRRQRLAALAQAQQKATNSVKVRLYCSQAGGDRNLIREIEVDGRSFGDLIR